MGVFEDLQGNSPDLALKAAKSLVDLEARSIREQMYQTPWGSEISTWDIFESAYQAALLLGDYDTANRAIRALKSRFPNSRRVQRLAMLALEIEEPKEALDRYKKMREQDPADFVKI